MPQDTGLYAIIASGSAAIGAIISKIIFYKHKEFELKHDEAIQIRKELKERCLQLEHENAELRKTHFEQMTALKEEIFMLKSEIKVLKQELSSLYCKRVKIDNDPLQK